MNMKDVIKNIKDIRVPADVKILLVGFLLIIGVDRCVFGHKDVDTAAIDKEIATAQAALRVALARYQESAAVRDMYKHKCDSLTPVFGVYESPADRARRNAQWRQFRDSLSKYGDRAIDMEIALGWAQLRVDTLVSNRNSMTRR